MAWVVAWNLGLIQQIESRDEDIKDTGRAASKKHHNISI
jgi:hypothetical protein